ncbi:MAG TPA: N-acetyltransferase [Blastocatellia bacterium]|nr:N-acetyltransferase [Blastocatellia bacterium]
MTATSIKTAAPTDEERAISVIVLAFSSDPVARWTYPDPHDYLRYFPEVVRAFGGNAFQHGTGYHADSFQGAALWLPPGVQPREEEMVALLQRSIPDRNQEEVFSVMEQMGSYHISEPHWYLPLIGVDPAKQGMGIGSALMKHALAECDRENLPAYLESSNPRNIPLYERHGFEVIGTIQAGSSPPIYPMLRKPRSA